MRKQIGLSLALLMAPGLVQADLSDARRAELINLLEQDCGSCHGLTFKGGLGPALTAEALSGKPREMVVATVLEGRPGTPMAPWKNMLTRQEAEWLVERLYNGGSHAR